MFRKTILIFLSLFSFSYAVDEIDIEKRRQEQQDFDNLIKSQNFSVPKSSEGSEQKNLILNVNSINLEGNTIFEDFQIDALLRKYIGKNKDVYLLINELENKYIERGYVTTKVGLNTEKSDFDNGNTALTLLRSGVDHAEVTLLVQVRVLVSQHLGDGSGQGGLTVVNVTNGTDVNVRLGALELSLSQECSS